MDKKICSVAECTTKVRAKGLCGRHYERMRAHGDTTTDNRATGPKRCIIEGCTGTVVGRGWCSNHYSRWWRHGDTDSLIPMYGSHSILRMDGYVGIWNGVKYKLEHIILAEQALGRALPDKAVVHHMNKRKADNKTPHNLIICQDQAYHFLLHRRMRDFAKNGFCFPEGLREDEKIEFAKNLVSQIKATQNAT